MRYVLSYVNLPERTINLDMEFAVLSELETFVKANFPRFTSYQVIVTAKRV